MKIPERNEQFYSKSQQEYGAGLHNLFWAAVYILVLILFAIILIF